MNTENLKPNSQKILIIDDEVEICKSLVRQFKRRYTVFTATDTAEALRFLETEDIQVIISDQRMPGMTGTEFFSKIKSRFPNIIKLILTGYSDINNVIEAINQAQVFKYITKPWNPEELEWTINEAFEKYELQAENRLLLINLAEVNQNLEKKIFERTQKLNELNVSLTQAIAENKKNSDIIELIFNSIPGLIFLYNEDNELVKWNRRHLSLTGFTAKELATKKLTDWIANDFESIKALDTTLNAMALKGFGETELYFQKKDGSKLPLFLTLSSISINGSRYIAGIGVDITDLKKAKEKLLEQMEELKFLHRNSQNRELLMLDLKIEINKLLKKMGEKERYLPTGEEID